MNKGNRPVTTPTYGTFDWLRVECGEYLGYDGDFAVWNHDEVSRVESCVSSGLKRFYFPPSVAEEEERHQWSFLSPVTTLDVTSGTATYDLPSDFVGGVKEFTLPSNLPVSIISEAELRAVQGKEGAANDEPKFAAIRPKAASGTAEQAWEVTFYPTPDSSYTLSYAYQRNPALLSSSVTHPYGGTEHAETILESVLAVAEERYKEDGDRHQAAFKERLAGSVMLDQRLKSVTGQSWDITEPDYGTYQYFHREVGVFLGFPYNSDAWSYDQDRRANAIVQSGLRQFYFPPRVQEQQEMYCWSFLKPTATLDTANADYDYDLPADFGMVLESITHTDGDDELRLERVTERKIRSLRSSASATGAPKYYAVRPKSADYTAEQSYELVLYPTPDAVYNLEYTYNVSPPDATSVNKYPLGTRAHSDTVLASCLACAEIDRDSARGPRHEAFMERLSASVSLDHEVSK